MNNENGTASTATTFVPQAIVNFNNRRALIIESMSPQHSRIKFCEHLDKLPDDGVVANTSLVFVSPPPRVAELVPSLTSLLDWALACVRRGWFVFPCHPRTKQPAGEVVPHGWKDAANDEKQVREWWAKNPLYNPAIALDPSNLVVYDFDEIKPFCDLPATFTVKTGRTPKDGIEGIQMYYTGSCKTHGHVGGGGEVRSRGAYVMAPGSIHPSGNPYVIVADVPLAPSPEQNDETVKPLEPAIGTEEQEKKAAFVEAAFDASDIFYRHRVAHEGGFKWLIVCPWSSEHSQGEDFDSSSAVIMWPSGKFIYECKHSHCLGIRQWEQLRGTMEEVAGRYLQFGDPVGGVVLAGAPEASTAPAWDEPQPLDNTLLPVQPFRIEFLPSSLRPWVRDVSERMSVPLDFAGICALSVLAGVVNRRVFVYPKQQDKEWKEALAISGAVIASSGKLKTPTWKTFTNLVLELEYDWREAHQKRMALYKEELKGYDAARKEQKKDKENRVCVPDEPKEPPPCRRLMQNDSTPEMMHKLMTENPEGLFVYRDELASWVAELDKEGREVERGMCLAAMNGNDGYTIDRIGRGSLFAIMSASLFGGFQPELLVEFLSDTRNISDGMIARFGLLCWPDSTVRPRVDRMADDEAKQRFRRVIRILAELKAESIFLHFTPAAQPRFNDWYDIHDLKVNQEAHSGQQSHLSKYRGLLPKLAALLQLADIVDAAPSPVGNHLIDLEHLNRAITLLAYLEGHMRRVYGSIKSPEQKALESLGAHIQNGDLEDGFSIRDIRRKHWEHLSEDTIGEAIESLEEFGWLRPLAGDKNPGRGRRTPRWEINPASKPKRCF